MKHKWNQRQWFTEAKRDASFYQCPLGLGLAGLLSGPDIAHPRGLTFRTVAVRKDPDFDDITCAAIGQHVQFQHTNCFNMFDSKRIFFIGLFHQFPESNHRDHVAAIDTLRLPIQNIFGGIANNIGTICIFPVRWPAGATGPINEGATSTNGQNLTDDTLAESEQRRAHQIHVVSEHTESTTNTSVAVRKFYFGVTAKEQTKEAISRAAGGIKETSTSFVAEIFVFRLRIETRQIFNSTFFNRILAGNDITSAQPAR